jgi:hypothetical protein
VLAGLAEEKPDFLQGLRKNVFARHDECSLRNTILLDPDLPIERIFAGRC